MRTGSRERYTASPVSVLQAVSAMTAPTHRDSAGKRTAPSSPGNRDAGFGRRPRCCARSLRFPAPRRSRAPEAGRALAERLSAVGLGYCGGTAYRVCDKACSHPRRDLMHFTNEKPRQRHRPLSCRFRNGDGDQTPR